MKRYRTRRQQVIETLGSRCNECGIGDARRRMRLYHEDPDLRLIFNFTIIQQMRWEDVQEQLSHARLLCVSCFREHNDGHDPGHSSVGHGGGSAGVKRCSCKLCRDRKAEYMRDFRKAQKVRQG